MGYKNPPPPLHRAQEPVLEPELEIVDPHHHLWIAEDSRWSAEEFLVDLNNGHNVIATVFVQSDTALRVDGPREWATLGETEYVNGIGAVAASGGFGPRRLCQGMVGSVDLTLDPGLVDELLRGHQQVAGKRFKGVRNLTCSDPAVIVTRPGLLGTPEFRAGAARLAPLGLSLDVFVFHPQLPEVEALARALPDTTIILNHIGMPLGVGGHKREEVFPHWARDMAALSALPNLAVKIGGFGMGVMGLTHPKEASSAELDPLWRPYVDMVIGHFGADRCMFESNFPVDGQIVDYRTLWNVFKRITAHCSAAEKASLFRDTARRVYRLP